MSPSAIRLRGFTISCGPPIGDVDWWALQRGICEGIVCANRLWMRGRDLSVLDLETCEVRYVPSAPIYAGGGLHQQARLAPAVLHDREGSCVDLSCWLVALMRERAGVREDSPRSRSLARVEFQLDPITQSGHAIARVRGQVWDPASLA